MNFDDAIAAHVRWKIRLHTFIAGREELDEATVRRDDQCDLGRWIHGEGRGHSSCTEYGKLVDEHARFHHVAADVVKLTKAGRVDEARAMLEFGTEFANRSSAVVSAIVQIRKTITGA